jgi:hypothetical protein
MGFLSVELNSSAYLSNGLFTRQAFSDQLSCLIGAAAVCSFSVLTTL